MMFTLYWMSSTLDLEPIAVEIEDDLFTLFRHPSTPANTAWTFDQDGFSSDEVTSNRFDDIGRYYISPF
ncbi:MAG: hypothetical protein JWP57_4576 [Spirosoma sp.]|nr:hypothetical protein [Spirosoma sp.]